jgi:hypothetical protein
LLQSIKKHALLMKTCLQICLTATFLALFLPLGYAVDYTFNAANGDWNTASNWTPNGIPGAGDNATIPNIKICTLSTAGILVNNLTINGKVVQSGGSIACSGLLKLMNTDDNFMGNIAIFNQSGNLFNNLELLGRCTLTLNMPTATFNQVTMDETYANPQKTTNNILNGSANLVISGNLNMTYGVIRMNGNISVAGNFTWAGGTIGANPASSMNVSGAANFQALAGTGCVLKHILFTLNTNSSWSSGNIYIDSSAAFRINSGINLSSTGNEDLSFLGTNGSNVNTLDVQGSFIKNGTGVLTFSNFLLLNSNPINVNAGTLRLSSMNLNLQADLNILNGSTLEFNGGVCTQSAGLINSTGLMLINGSPTITLNNYSINNLQFNNAGTLNLGMATSTINNLTMYNGTLTGNTNLVVTGTLTSTYNQSSQTGGTISNNGTITCNQNFDFTHGKINNTGTVTVNGNFNWAGGELGSSPTLIMTVLGTTTFGAATSAQVRKLSRTLEVQGGGTWTTNYLLIYNDGLFRIPVGQTFTATVSAANSVECNPCSSSSGVDVLGTFEKNGSASLVFNAPLRNSGSFNLNAGTLRLNFGKILNGNISGQAGTTIEVGGDVCTQTSGTVNCATLKILSGTTALNANGNSITSCQISGGTLTLGSTDATIGTLAITGGTLNGSADIAVSGNASLDGGGSINNTGAFTVNGNFNWIRGVLGPLPSSQMTINGVSTFALTGSGSVNRKTMIVAGGGSWTQGNFSLGDNGIFRIPSGATFTESVSTSASISAVNGASTGTIDNQGLFSITNGGSTSCSGVAQTNSGTLSIESGALISGYIFNNSGTVKGIGSIELPFPYTNHSNTGTYAPGLSPGTLSHIGLYTNSTLAFEISESGGVVSKDLLSVTGSMTLGGTLNISHLSGTIPAGTYDIATCSGTRTGTFATVNYPPSCNGNCSINYTGNKAQFVINTPLPLELLRFNAYAANLKAVLNWSTANETGIRNFGIERSSNAVDWTVLAEQTANNQPESSSYQWTDEQAQPALENTNTLYYRLRINEIDGRFSYSPIMRVSWPDAQALKIYPNPVGNNLTFIYDSASEAELPVRLLDAFGREQFRQIVSVRRGEQSYDIFVGNLPPGQYWLLVGDATVAMEKY